MPVPYRKSTTSYAPKQVISENQPLSSAEFRKLVRERARSFIRQVLEEVMQEEITAFLGAEWGEQGNVARQGQRNGYYHRTLYTGYGQIEDHRRSHEAGFNAHLVKPIDLDALAELLAHPELAARPVLDGPAT